MLKKIYTYNDNYNDKQGIRTFQRNSGSLFFGASVLTDAYYSAFKISNFFRQLLGEGALGNTFIPLYHKKKKEEGEERSREYIFQS